MLSFASDRAFLSSEHPGTGRNVGDESDTNDRFESLRVPIDRGIELRLDAESGWTREAAANLSMNGLFVQTGAKYEPGTVLEVRLNLREGEPPIHSKATVLWRRERDAGPDRPRGIGARFLELDLESKYAISRLVERYAQLGEMPFQLTARASPAEALPAASRLDRRGVLSLLLAFTAGLAIGWAGSLWLQPPAGGVLPATERSGSALKESAAVAEPSVLPPVESAVKAWAEAWSEKDVDRYLSFYSESFQPASGQPLAAWKTERRRRLTRQGSIEVEVSALEVEAVAEDRVIARFDQTYASPGYRDRVRKALELVLEEPEWRVVREEALGEPGR